MPLAWLVVRVRDDRPMSTAATLLFLLFASAWVLGQGMHLAANSIGHYLDERGGAPLERLVYFYDERLGHYLWHAGVVGFSALAIFRQAQNPFTGWPSSLRVELVAGLVYGVVFFLMVIEGQTAPLGVPFAALAVVTILVAGYGRMREMPILGFFLTGYAVMLLLVAGWAAYWHGLPQFSDVGLL